MRDEWEKSLTAVFFLAGMGASLKYLYGNVLRDLAAAGMTEEYSYLLVIGFVLALLLAETLRSAEPLKYPRVSRLLVLAVFSASSGILWLLSGLLPEHILELRAAGLVAYAWGLAAALYDSKGLRRLLYPLLTLLFLIPVPRGVLELVAVRLSRLVGEASAMLTGFRLVEEGSRMFLDYGAGRLELIYGCSGIVGLSSIAAMTPLIIYAVRSASRGRMILGALIGLAAGSSVAFAGNILRVSMVAWAARREGVGEAVGLLHQIPAAIYVSLAVITAFYAASRITGPPSREKELTGRSIGASNLIQVLGVFMVLVVVSSLGVAAMEQRELKGRIGVKAYSYSYISSHMDSLAFSASSKILYSKPVPALIRVLGSSIVEEVGVEYRGHRLRGYVEFAETPARFHSWWVCLTYQGYRVRSTWRDMYNGTIIVFIDYEDGLGNTYMLGYTIYAVPIYFDGKVDEGYLRISLLKHVGRQSPQAEKLIGEALTQGVSRKLTSGTQTPPRTMVIRGLQVYYATLAAIIAYYAASYAYDAAEKIRRKWHLI